MFYIIADELFHTVLKDADGEWIISYDNSASPTYVSDDLLKKYQKVKAPDKYIENKDRELSEAEKQRKNMIQPLLDDIQCIKCKKKRIRLAKNIAVQYGTTERRILRLYYQYLSTGMLIKPKPPKSESKNEGILNGLSGISIIQQRKYHYRLHMICCCWPNIQMQMDIY